MEIQVNYIEVLIAGAISMGLGFFWYSPGVLGKQWMKEKGLNSEKLKKEQKEMGKLYIFSFVLALITAYVLSHVMNLSSNFFGYPMIQTGITSAFWMWLGFVMPVQATTTIFGNKNWKLFGIDTGYQLVSLLAMGVVIGSL
ncbi:DUF1761 domain-containing protein [Candidatus Roizmanbacteria bacterium]|nr:DUF1761 domain-containing protein [Candidatus Roizmanbacteria bacterium]